MRFKAIARAVISYLLIVGLSIGLSESALAKSKKKKHTKPPATQESEPLSEGTEEDDGPSDPVDQFDLAMKTTPSNATEALQWLKKSAAQGYPPAQFRLGQSYEIGQGVAQNPEEAIKWYLKSAKQGSALAQYNLALLYEKAGNQKEAVYWLAQSAQQLSTAAQYELAMHYESGLGVKKSLGEAYKYLVLASADGAPTHTYNRNRVAKLLTPKEAESIETLVDKWLQSMEKIKVTKQ